MMTLGKAPAQEELYRSSRAFCQERLAETSIYRLLSHECHRLFPDEAFADLFEDSGRRSVPPRVVAVVMVLQRIEGLSDREAVERFTFDARWKYAAAGLDGFIVQIRPSKDGGGLASFAQSCAACPLRTQCTKSIKGRSIRVHPRERTLQRSRNRQNDPAWKARYKATRPKVERKLAHMMLRRHGGRRARVRGCLRVRHDFALLAAAINLKRLAALRIHYEGSAWLR